MSFNSKSGKQIEASKTGLWIMQERQQLKQLHNEKYGSCRHCELDDSLNDPRCRDCINSGGTMRMFREKQRKRRRDVW